MFFWENVYSVKHLSVNLALQSQISNFEIEQYFPLLTLFAFDLDIIQTIILTKFQAAEAKNVPSKDFPSI